MALPNNPTQSEVVKAIKDLENTPAQATDVQVNGTSIVSNNVANIVTESAYNASTNKIATKADITKANVGLSNVDNVRQYSASNPPPYPVTSVNGQTGAVTGLATSNPNLLINSNFAINQRGKSSYVANATSIFTVDRWVLWCDGSASFTVSSKQLDAPTDPAVLGQYIEDNLPTGQYTLSINVGGTVYSQTGTLSTTSSITINMTNLNCVCSYKSNNKYRVEITIDAGHYAIINWVKLEVGSVATDYTPPIIAEELLKCQRYFVKLGNIAYKTWSGYQHFATTNGFFTLALPVPMRTTPTMILASGASSMVVVGNGKTGNPTACTVGGFSGNEVRLSVTLPSANTSSWDNQTLVLRPEQDVSFDAEI